MHIEYLNETVSRIGRTPFHFQTPLSVALIYENEVSVHCAAPE